MQIQTITKGKRGRLQVELEGGLSFPIYEKEAAAYQIAEGGDLSAEDWERLRAEVLDKRAKRRAMYLLQQMDRTEAQLRRKLAENGYPEEVADAALDYVRSFHYVDDYRYACAYVRSYRKEKSCLQIKMKLRERGISSDVIERALEEEYSEGEEAIIERLLEKKHYADVCGDRKEKQKIYAYLMRRGFSSASVLRCMRQLEEGQF